jgi:dipeptidase E
MRMLLTSEGVHNDLIRDKLVDLLGKPIEEASIVAVIDAILPFGGDNTKTLTDLQRLRDLGWKQYDLLSLFAGPTSLVESRLRSADVIFCYGGSNHWLAHAWHASGLAPVLAELLDGPLDEKVYLGWSAGSMIFSRLQQRSVEAFYDQDEVAMFELDTVAPAVPLFDWFVICHRGAEWQPQVTDEVIAKCAARLGGPVYFLDDETALLVRDAASAPEVVSTGQWRLFDGAGRLVEQNA